MIEPVRIGVPLVAVALASGLHAQRPPQIVSRDLGTVTSFDTRFRVEVVAEGLIVPVGLAFLPDGGLLVAERAIGRLSIFDLRRGTITAVEGVPEVRQHDDAGLLDVLVHPDFAHNHLLYLAYSAESAGISTTAVDRARLDGRRLVERTRLFTARPFVDSDFHYGGRLVLRNGYLFITVGDRERRGFAQDLSVDNGKIIRLREDGRIPEDNPFVNQKGALPEIWSYGHRNPQGLTLHPVTRALWEDEHGPRGGDEVNLIEGGKNYGWPVITYGHEYEGGPVGEGLVAHEGMERPVYYYTPSIAPSGMEFYTGDALSAWKGNLFIGGMGLRHLNRLIMQGDTVVGEERLLRNFRWRVRVVRQGPDGRLYLGVDEGMLVRLRP